MSWVDLANNSPVAAVSHTTTSGTTGGNIFWTTLVGSTVSGGRFYWRYSGSGTDVVTVNLWNNNGNVLVATSTPISITASGVYTFTWASGGPVTLVAYQMYTIGMYSVGGYTSISANSTNVSNAITNNFVNYGQPPWTGTLMAGPSLNWYVCGIVGAGGW